MNVIKTEPDSSGDSSLDGSEDVEEDSLGVMLPDVRLETEEDLSDEKTGVDLHCVAPRDELVDVNHLVPITCLAVKSEVKAEDEPWEIATVKEELREETATAEYGLGTKRLGDLHYLG